MDFALDESQTAICELARQILTDRLTSERLKEVETGEDWFDPGTWSALAKADLLGITLPESAGGGGFGFLEACLILQEAGRTVAPLPLWATLTAAHAVAELGTDAQQAAWLPGVASGDVILTVALAEPDAASTRTPAARATADSDGWRLSGSKTGVPAMHLAAAVLIPALLDDRSVGLFLVPTDAAGLRAERQDTFNHEPQFHLTLDDVAIGPEARLGADRDGEVAFTRLVDRATVGLCAVASGVAEVGMRITAGYVTKREQFGRAIGTFQAVCHRMADCYIDAAAINLTMLQAATRLAESGPDETVDPKVVAVAKYWASYGGSRIGHADLHLHGGISIDLEYAIHRYFLWSKHLELQLDAATQQLAHLGAVLAAEPVAV